MVEVKVNDVLEAEFPTMQEALEWIDPFQWESDMCFEVVCCIIAQI